MFVIILEKDHNYEIVDYSDEQSGANRRNFDSCSSANISLAK